MLIKFVREQFLSNKEPCKLLTGVDSPKVRMVVDGCGELAIHAACLESLLFYNNRVSKELKQKVYINKYISSSC